MSEPLKVAVHAIEPASETEDVWEIHLMGTPSRTVTTKSQAGHTSNDIPDVDVPVVTRNESFLVAKFSIHKAQANQQQGYVVSSQMGYKVEALFARDVFVAAHKAIVIKPNRFPTLEAAKARCLACSGGVVLALG